MCLLLRIGFRLATLPWRPDWSAAEMGEPSRRTPISTEALGSSVRVTIGLLAPSLPKALLPQLLSLAGRPALGRVFHFKNDGGHCVLGDLQCWGHFLVPFPKSVPRHNPVSELYGQFPRPHGLVFALFLLWRALATGGPYIDSVPFQIVQSIAFSTGGLQVIETSRMVNGNRMHLSSISSFIAKGLNTYVNKVYVYFL